MKLAWKEEDGRFQASPAEGVEVLVQPNGPSSEWIILVGGEWVKRGMCREMDDAKALAELEAEAFRRG